MTASPLLLASASPRRQELLAQAGVDLEVVVAEDAEPQRNPGEECALFACRAAKAKAVAVAAQHPGRLTLGADTIVVLDEEVLGKPRDAQDAAQMLRRLSGRTHRVMTGIAFAVCEAAGPVTYGVTPATQEALAAQGARVWAHTDCVVTEVTFRVLDETQIADYVATGEPLDKAGAYGIQGLGGVLVAEYKGSYSNVVGLPLEAVQAFLHAWRAARREGSVGEAGLAALTEAYITARKACMVQ